MFDSNFLSSFLLAYSRRFLSAAAILSSLVWVVFTGHQHGGGGEGLGGEATTAQRRHSPSPQVSPFTINRL